MTKKRRMLCVMMSIFLIMSSVLTGLPANGKLTKVEAASSATLPVELNFEADTVGEAPTGWVEDSDHATEDAGKTTMLVAEESNTQNHMVKLNQTAARSSDYHVYYNFVGSDAAVLEYKFKTGGQDSDADILWLPTLAYDDQSGSPLYLYMEYGFRLKYSSINGDWVTATGVGYIDPYNWHTIKLVVDLKNNVRELYLDGAKLTLDQTNLNKKDCDSTKKLGSVTAGFYKSTVADYYIDDVSVQTYVEATGLTFEKTTLTITEEESVALKPQFTPANASASGIAYVSADSTIATVDASGKVTGVKAGETTITATPALSSLAPVTISVTVKAKEVATIPFTLNFEDGTDGTVPQNWVWNANNNSSEADKSSMLVTTEGTNKIVELKQTDSRVSQYYMHYYFKETNKAVLKYRFKAKAGSGIIWLPSLSYEGRSRSPLHLMLSNGTSLQYTGAGLDYWQVASNNLAADTWHTVKFVVDVTQGVRELYVDDMQIALNEEHLENYKCESESVMNSISLGFYSATSNATYYIDDMSVEAYIAGENVSFPASVTVPKGGYVVLQPEFTPADTSVQGVSYSSSDSSVATVDNNGKITGISDGQVTITAKPALDNLATATITVTVNGEVEGNITVDSEDITLAKGGHVYLNAGIEFSAGISADDTLEYVSADPETVTVDKWGEILAKKAGETTISITSVVNPNIVKTIDVTVEESSVDRTIYVSPTGTGDGTSEQTPTTLQGAIAQLATVNKDTLTGDIEVILKDGYYYQSETLALNDSHGGNHLYSVIFKAAEDGNDEAPVIGGGIFVAGSAFAETSGKAGVYEYDLSQSGLSNVKTRQLYVNNVRATRARSEGTLTNAEYLYDEDGTNIGLVCDNTELLDYTNPQDLEMVSFNQWTHQRCQVAEVRDNAGRVELIMDQPGWYNVTRVQSFMATRPDTIEYYENTLELLDEPGEWYLDENAQKLYYMPRIWEDMNEVKFTIPVLDGEMITVIGTSSEKQVHNICFDGITFADTTWMRPSTDAGHPANQNNHLNDSKGFVDAAITVQKANSVQFLNCTFTRLGINAINMNTGVQNALIMGNHFYDISGNAIAIGTNNYKDDVDNYNPTDVKKMMKNCDVLNNYIHDIGVDYRSSSAVSVGFAANVDLCNNEIFNVPYCGFHIGYSWSSTHKNITENMNVSNNFIHDFMFDGVFDGGAIYTNGATNYWNIASGNYIRNQGDKLAALYADEGTTYWKFTDNVVDLSENEIGYTSLSAIRWGGVNVGGGNILMENNYTSIDRYTGENTAKNIRFTNNTVVSDLNWPEKATEIIAASGLQDAYTGLRNNQAERIVVSIPEVGLDVNVGDTYHIQVTVTDGKDIATTLNSDDIIAYEIADKEVATVSEQGVITANAEGQTKVFIHVVSNGILDTIERDIFVGDAVEELCLKNFDNNITLYLNSNDLQLEPYGVTENHRKVSFKTVTYQSNDLDVVTVDENGLLKAVGVGETTLIVTGQMGSEPGVEKTFQIVVNEPISEYIYYPDEMFKSENESKWVGGKKTWTLTPDQKIETSPDKWITYSGQTYTDELLTFRMSIAAVDWPSIVLRAQTPDKCVALGETGYIICLKDMGIEVQRFNGSARTVLFGNVEGHTPVFGNIISPNPLADDALHEISVGALNEADGVRLVMYIDGEEIYNVLDKSEYAIKNAGYFGLVGYNNDPFVLEKLSPNYTAGLNTSSDKVSVGETVNVNVAVNRVNDNAFATGEVVITYDAAKLSFNEEKSKSMLNGATVAYDNEEGTLTLEDFGENKSFGNAVYKLAFDTKAAGEAAVSISSAAFLDTENAAKEDLMPATISPASVTVTVNKLHNVTLPEGFTGDATVTNGAAYTFSLSEDAAFFEYDEITATVDGQLVNVTDNGNGTYTIAEVTGVLVISCERTAKSFTVTIGGFEGIEEEITDAASTATYGTDYTFTMPTADGFAYKLESLKINGVNVTQESVYTVDPETNKYTITGSAIKGVIEMSISKTATKAGVTVNGTGASAAAGYNASATIGADYTLTIVPESGWTYVVTAIMNGETAVVIDNTNNTYTIKAVTGSIEFTVERILKMDGFEVTNYMTIDGKNIWLVKNTTALENGKVYTYDGNKMFWSDKYQAYCYTVIKENFTAADLNGKVSIENGTAGTVEYDRMDVNMSGKLDASDAQFVYNIYNAMYDEFTQDVTVEKFLRADVNGDAVVNVLDAAAIINYILAQ